MGDEGTDIVMPAECIELTPDVEGLIRDLTKPQLRNNKVKVYAGPTLTDKELAALQPTKTDKELDDEFRANNPKWKEPWRVTYQKQMDRAALSESEYKEK